MNASARLPRSLAVVVLALVLTFAPTVATATGPVVAPDPGASATVDAEPAVDDAPSDDLGEASGSSPVPIEGWTVLWKEVPEKSILIEESQGVLIAALVELQTVVGGEAHLSRREPSGAWTEVALPQSISGIRGDKEFSWLLAPTPTPGIYRITTVTGLGSVENEYQFTLRVQLGQPSFSVVPADQEVREGEIATFSARADSGRFPASSIQGQVSTDGGRTWQNEGAVQGGGGLATIDVVGGARNSGWLYRFVAKREDANGYHVTSSATTPGARLTVGDGSPRVTGHPAGVTVQEGATAVFEASVAAASSTKMDVEWQYRENASAPWVGYAFYQNLESSTSSRPVSDVTLAMDGWQFRAVFSNTWGSAGSEAATLTVVPAAPVVVEHPADQTVVEGGAATFTSAATGSTAVRWQRRPSGSVSWSDILGATSSTYTVSAARLGADGDQYRAVFRNGAGSVETDGATLSVQAAVPRVTEHPQDARVTEGGSVSFTAAYTGTEAEVSVQWEVWNASTGWSDIPGATSGTYTVDASTLEMDGQQYMARFSSVAGVRGTNPATLTVAPALPRIVELPRDIAIVAGGSVTFRTAYTGTASAVSVRWEVRPNASSTWAVVEDVTTLACTVSGATMAMNGWQYRVVLTNAAGSATSGPATLTVLADLPQITDQPQDITVAERAEARFTAAATSSTSMSMQWQQRVDASGTWVDIPGATSGTYVEYDVTLAMSGRQYRAVFTTATGAVASDPATLTVTPGLPTILLQPQDQTVNEDEPATFVVVSTSITTTAVQWETRADETDGWTEIPGATSNTHRVTGTTPAMNGHQFRAVLTNAAGTVTSDAATLTVRPGRPWIALQPSDTTVTEGADASFFAIAGSSTTYSMRWESRASESADWTEIPDATTSGYRVAEASLSMDGHQFRMVATNDVGSVSSDAATLLVEPAVPQVAEQPEDATTTEGGSVTFSAAHTGTESEVSVRWQVRASGAVSWSDIIGATSGTHTVSGATLAMNGHQYRAVFANAAGSAETTAATLLVDPVLPVVTTHPEDVTVIEGGSAIFSATYGGTESEVSTSWQYSVDGGQTFGDVPPDAVEVQAGDLVIDRVDFAMRGWQFRAGFANTAGQVWSGTATLNVLRVRPINLQVTPRVVRVDSLPGRE